MKPKYLLTLSALFAGLSTQPTLAQTPMPVLVELFTSQGCSSCPPAERWLNGRGMELFHQGKIIPLAFHVDYWDYLGWKDPFSSRLFTARQRQYAEALQDGSLYTPEMVVAGRAGFVGSDGVRALSEINDPQNNPAGKPIPLRLISTDKGSQLELDLTAQLDGAKLWVAFFENDLLTQVQRGENGGKSLEENFVVRQLTEVKVKPGFKKAHLAIPAIGVRAHQGAVVFAQDEETRRILSTGLLFPFH
jgi:hypothetical protein